MLIDEINCYDQKTKEQEESLKEGETESAVNKTRIKDYKKTSLLKAVTLFEEFLRALEKAERKRSEIGKKWIIVVYCNYIFFNFTDTSMEF